MKKIIILTLALIFVRTADATQKNAVETLSDLEKLEKTGNLDAGAILGDLACDGFINLDRETAKKLIEKSYHNGSIFGKYAYGSAIGSGKLGFEKNKPEGRKIVTEAIPTLKELAEKGNGFACLFLYYIYSSDQSEEGKNIPESLKWLTEGDKLGNPFCAFYMSREALNIPEDQYIENKQTVDNAVKNLGLLITHFKFTKEKVKQLYAEAILANFEKSKFVHMAFHTDGESVLNLFRNNRLNCNAFLNYKITDKKYTLGKPPEILIEHSQIAEIDRSKYNAMNSINGLEYSLDIFELLNLLDCQEKMSDWEGKAYTLNPPAFEKCINENRENNQKAIVFYWDGINSVNYGIGIYDYEGVFRPSRILSRFEKDLLCNVFLSAYDIENDPHSFYKKSQSNILEAVKNRNKKQNLIDETFK